MEDTTAPILSLTGDNNHSHGVNTPWADLGYSATDSLEGNLTANVAISGDIDVNTTGEYTLTYSVSDSSGNEANLTRTVNVAEIPQGPWTFTNAGATGRFGPTQSQIDANYSGTSLEGLVTINSTHQGIQEWTVPANGTYLIEAWGQKVQTMEIKVLREDMELRVKGQFILNKDANISILVGQSGSEVNHINGGSWLNGGGGGGGTFIFLSSAITENYPLIAAAGGGGAGRDSNGTSGLISQSASSGLPENNWINSPGDGGSNGYGGAKRS